MPGRSRLSDAAAGRRGDAGLQRDVVRRRAVLVDQLQDPGRRHRQRAGQRGGHGRPFRRRNQRRVGEDHVGLHGHGQHLAVAGRDGSAHRRDRDLDEPLLLSQLPVGGPVQALELDEPAGEQRQGEDDADQRDIQPPGRTAPAQCAPEGGKAVPAAAPPAATWLHSPGACPGPGPDPAQRMAPRPAAGLLAAGPGRCAPGGGMPGRGTPDRGTPGRCAPGRCTPGRAVPGTRRAPSERRSPSRLPAPGPGERPGLRGPAAVPGRPAERGRVPPSPLRSRSRAVTERIQGHWECPAGWPAAGRRGRCAG